MNNFVVFDVYTDKSSVDTSDTYRLAVPVRNIVQISPSGLESKKPCCRLQTKHTWYLVKESQESALNRVSCSELDPQI